MRLYSVRSTARNGPWEFRGRKTDGQGVFEAVTRRAPRGAGIRQYPARQRRGPSPAVASEFAARRVARVPIGHARPGCGVSGEGVMKAEKMFSVEGYGAIVTGGASGLGLAFTEVLAEHGARVTMLDLNPERIEREGARLRAAGWDVRGMVVDVTDHAALDRAFDDTAAKYGRIDVVFANVGIDSGPGFVTLDRKTRVPEGALENYTDERWNRVIDTNLNSVFATVRAAARHMKPR